MRKYILFFMLPSLIAAVALAASSRDNETLERARQMQLEFRQGKYEVAFPLVEMLEKAVAQSPSNASLWEALGHASMSKEGAMYLSPPDMAALLATAKRAREAYARALELNPNNHLARASHGMAQLVTAQQEGDGPGVMAGVEEMNAAVRDAPKSIAVRLVRAFTIIYLPPDMRDNDAVTSDLQFILDYSTGGRPEDVLRVMLGDVFAEIGKLDAARAEYRQVTGASAFAADQVKLRFAGLEKGAISPEHIAKVRASTGSQCATCHAAGTDN